MGDSNLPIIEPTIDFTKVPPIHQKRTISFINHFVVNAVSFLNKLALNCEEKLFDFENKLQRIEAAVVILESRLASIPSCEEKLPVPEKVSQQLLEDKEKVDAESIPPAEAKGDIDETDKLVDEGANDKEKLIPICKHPLYEEFFRMKNIGAAVEALKRTMTLRGLDPDALDDPQRQVPNNSPEGPIQT
ncbi:WASH complex subunit 3 [Venturia canescens]|uniref:WASH complex subunit 3 n=1 Tax=Venturia canescens TaxID=32260 RepID=UPI001C9D2B96|nr:WASH complex subunit 3 [Venturia canescens]